MPPSRTKAVRMNDRWRRRRAIPALLEHPTDLWSSMAGDVDPGHEQRRRPDERWPCSNCGKPIAEDDFQTWPDAPRTAFAVCGWCGSSNGKPAPFILALNENRATPPQAAAVFGVLGGGWRAACVCGRTARVDGEADGWLWI